MERNVNLLTFKPEELIFDEDETREILKFIFPASRHSLIDGLVVDHDVREFAQALLVEAVDASYDLGFVEKAFRASANPGASATKVISKFARQAARHWFKHVKASDLREISIYDVVRDRLAANFGVVLGMLGSGAKLPKPLMTHLKIQLASNGINRVWNVARG